MKCANCGSDVSDNNKFCPNCGEKMQGAEAAAQSGSADSGRFSEDVVNLAASERESLLSKGEPTVALSQAQVNNMNQQNPGSSSNAQAGGEGQARNQFNTNPNANANNAKPPKKKSKAPIFIGLGLAVVVLLAIVSFAVFAGQNFFKRTFSSATDYYKYVEKRNVNSKDTWKAYDAYVKKVSSITSSKITQNMSIELSDDAKDLIGNFYPEDLDWFEKLDLVMELAAKDKNYEASISAKLNGKDIANVQAYADDDNIYATLPDMTDEYLLMSKDYLSDEGFDLDAYMSSFESLPSKDKLKSIATKYTNIYLKNVSGVKKEKVKLKAGEVTQSVYKLSYTLEEDKLQEVLQALAEAADGDSELRDVVRAYAEASMGTSAGSMGLTVDDIMDQYDSYIEDLQESIEDIDLEGVSLTMDTYVDNSGNIVGRDIVIGQEDEEEYFSYAFTRNGKNVGLIYSYEFGDNITEFSGTGKLSGANLSGEFKLTQSYDGDESSLLNVTVNKINMAKLGTDNQEIDVVISADEGLSDLYYGMDEFSDYALRLQVNKSKSVWSIIDGTDELVTITLTDDRSAAKKIDIPKNMETYDIEESDEIEAWVDNLDVDQYIDKLSDTDLPEEWVDTIEEYLSN